MCTSLDELVEELESYSMNFDDQAYEKTNKGLLTVWLRTNGGSFTDGWDEYKAVKMIETNLVTPAAKDYHHEFCGKPQEFRGKPQEWFEMWPMVVRFKASESILACWLLDFEEDHGTPDNSHHLK